MMKSLNQIGKILLSENEILNRVQELGRQIGDDYKDQELLIICVLKGAVIFVSDLLRNIDLPVELDFIQISSYGNETESSGEINVIQNFNTGIRDRNVLVVDDILDSGLTLEYLIKNIQSKSPKSLKVCVLLNKNKAREANIKADYVGFHIPDEFVIGYGLDYAEKYRGLRFIVALPKNFILDIQCDSKFL